MDDQQAHEFCKDPVNQQPSGPGRRRAGRRLTSMISVRFTPDLIARVKRWAAGDGITVGAWIRRAAAREEERYRRQWLDARHGGLQVVPGSGRLVTPVSPSPGSARYTFFCPHMSIGNVASAECAVCGPMWRYEQEARPA
jgi:hypothetical protein